MKKQRRTGSGYRELSVSGKPFVRRQNPGAGKGNPVSGKYAARDLGALRKEGVPDIGNARILGGKAARQVVFTRPQKFSGQSRQISRIGREMIELEDGSRLPVSRYRYPEVMARYEAWIRHAEFLE